MRLFYRIDPTDKTGRCSWFGGDFSQAHIDNLDAEGVPAAYGAHMDSDKSCPPCKTCQIILTALMCNQRNKTCREETPEHCKCP